MATLTGKKVQDTYKDLLQVSNTNAGIDGTMRAVEDGEGSASLLYLSTAGVAVNTGLNIGAATAVTGGKVTQTAALSAATGNEIAYSLAYTTNKSGSGDDTGLQIVQTDTASPGTSYLINALVASTRKFSVTNDGLVNLNGTTSVNLDPTGSAVLAVKNAANNLYLPVSQGPSSFYDASTNRIAIAYVTDTIPKISIASGGQFTFTSSATESAAGFDSGLARSAAGVVKVTDGSTGAGTITAGGLQTGVYTAVSDGKAIINATLNDAEGDEVAHKIAYTTNKATSGSDTGLEIVQTDTASPGTSYLINALVGSSSKFSVNNAGLVKAGAGTAANNLGLTVGVSSGMWEVGDGDLILSSGGTNFIEMGYVWDHILFNTPSRAAADLHFDNGEGVLFSTTSVGTGGTGADAGLLRAAAGVVKVTDGSTGIGRIAFERDKRQFGTHKTPGTAATVTEYGGAPTHTLTGTASNVSDATGHYVQLSGDGAAAGIDLAATECCKTEIDPVVTFIIKTGAALPTDAGERIWVGLASASLAASDSPSGIHVAAFRYAIDTDNTVFWRCVTNDGGADTGTSTTTTIAIAAATRYRLTIDATDSASIKFFINGALAATHTTNVPTATQALGTTCLTVDAGASTQEILISKIHYETT